MLQFTVEAWGPFACFTPPYAKVERISLPVPTPSALRGLLASIYGKPAEFYWTIDEIQVLNPIAYQKCRQNELQCKIAKNPTPIAIEAPNIHTQRQTQMLTDVHYRITATMHPRFPGKDFEKRISTQMERRLRTGQCFCQPCFGMRECVAYFAPGDTHPDKKPIPITQDFGLMTYDTHIPEKNVPGDDLLDLSLFHCTMVNGVIRVPDYNSPEVLKLGRPANMGLGKSYRGNKTNDNDTCAMA